MATLKLSARPFPARPLSFDPERLVEAMQREFRDSPYASVRSLVCRFHDGRLVMQGRVGSYFLKQVAQTTALRIAGAVPLDNQVEVVETR